MSTPDDRRTAFFPDTRWSLIYRAVHADACRAREALDELLRLYRPALLAHLRARWRLSPQDAEDLVHGFLVKRDFLLDILRRADRSKCLKFRGFLRKTLDFHVLDWLKTGRQEFPVPDVEAVLVEAGLCEQESLSCAFDREWARGVLFRVLDSMQETCRLESNAPCWEVFVHRLLLPCMDSYASPSIQALAHRLKLAPSRVWVLEKKSLELFKRTCRRIVGDYSTDRSQIEEEIRNLIADLAGEEPTR